MKCKICGEEKDWNKLSNSLANHIWNIHKIRMFDYATKYLNMPTEKYCECGCGEKIIKFNLESGWDNFIRKNHDKTYKIKRTHTPSGIRNKISETLKRKYKTGEIINKNKGKTKENCEYIKGISDKLKRRPLSAEHKLNVSKTLKLCYKNGTIQLWNKGKTKNNNESIKNIANKLTGKPLSIEHKKNISIAIKIVHETNPEIYKESHKQQSIRALEQSKNKKLWAQSEIGKRKLSESMSHKNATGQMLVSREDLPNSIERKVANWFKDELNYVGNGKFWITCAGKHKNPDFIVNNKRKIIEVFGDYYHRNDANKTEII